MVIKLANHSSLSDGMFRGFDCLVWIMTITNSIGGLLISIVIKYADNILKAFAQVKRHIKNLVKNDVTSCHFFGISRV